jgi:hypothetical protein
MRKLDDTELRGKRIILREVLLFKLMTRGSIRMNRETVAETITADVPVVHAETEVEDHVQDLRPVEEVRLPVETIADAASHRLNADVQLLLIDETVHQLRLATTGVQGRMIARVDRLPRDVGNQCRVHVREHQLIIKF